MGAASNQVRLLYTTLRYMCKEKRPWLLAKPIQRNLVKKRKKGYPCSEWHGCVGRNRGYQWMEHRGHAEWLWHTERKVAGARCCIEGRSQRKLVSRSARPWVWARGWRRSGRELSRWENESLWLGELLRGSICTQSDRGARLCGDWEPCGRYVVWNVCALSCVLVGWTENVSEWSAESRKAVTHQAGARGRQEARVQVVAQKKWAREDQVGCTEWKAMSVTQRLAKWADMGCRAESMTQGVTAGQHLHSERISWESHENFMRISRDSHMRLSWESRENLMRISWESHETTALLQWISFFLRKTLNSRLRKTHGKKGMEKIWKIMWWCF